MQNTSATKILIIDDDPDVVEATSLSFETCWPGAVAASADNGETGIEMVRTENPDLVILDIGLPGMDGYAVCKEIRSFSDVPITMLTVRDTEEDIIKGLGLGADDYLTKPFGPRLLLARAQAILRRPKTAPAKCPSFRYGTLEVVLSRQEVLLDGVPVKLTPIAYRLLYTLVTNAGRELSADTLFDRIWGREYELDSDHLEVHIRNLRDKLGDDPGNPQLIFGEAKQGFRVPKPLRNP